MVTEVVDVDRAPTQLAHAREPEHKRLQFHRLDAMAVDSLEPQFDAPVCLAAARCFPERTGYRPVSRAFRICSWLSATQWR